MRNKNLFGKYPSCDMCNNALRYIIEGKYDEAFNEIVLAIIKADGYFHDDINDVVKRKMDNIVK